MRKFIYMLAIAAMAAGCTGSSSKQAEGTDSTAAVADSASGNAADAAIIEFANVAYDFGKIKDGEKVSYSFKFKNAGKTPLIITNATATCGCTTPEYPHEPIAPGQTGQINVTFNSTGKVGKQDKVITVTSNAVPATSEVHLTGEVEAAKPAN